MTLNPKILLGVGVLLLLLLPKKKAAAQPSAPKSREYEEGIEGEKFHAVFDGDGLESTATYLRCVDPETGETVDDEKCAWVARQDNVVIPMRAKIRMGIV